MSNGGGGEAVERLQPHCRSLNFEPKQAGHGWLLRRSHATIRNRATREEGRRGQARVAFPLAKAGRSSTLGIKDSETFDWITVHLFYLLIFGSSIPAQMKGDNGKCPQTLLRHVKVTV